MKSSIAFLLLFGLLQTNARANDPVLVTAGTSLWGGIGVGVYYSVAGGASIGSGIAGGGIVLAGSALVASICLSSNLRKIEDLQMILEEQESSQTISSELNSLIEEIKYEAKLRFDKELSDEEVLLGINQLLLK